MWTSRALTTTKGVVAMNVIRYRPLLVLLIVCAIAPAAQAVTRTYEDVPRHVARGLYLTLRALRVHPGGARGGIQAPGVFVKSKLVVDACLGDGAASWSCTGR